MESRGSLGERARSDVRRADHPPASRQTEKKIAEIIDAYKKRFSQEAVFWMRMPAVAQAR
jgi:Protein of unknown function (DUF3574)